jgi:outer membrane protein, multidrug efflux system
MNVLFRFLKSTLRQGAAPTALLAVALLAGCAAGPDFKRPATPEAAAFSHSSVGQATTIETNWWRGFNDPQMEQLVMFASTNNLDLRLAKARLLEARALWTAARFDFVPTVTSDNYYLNTRDSIATKPKESRDGRHNEVYRVGFDATWELDLWGRVRRNTEAARATVEAVEADRDDVLVAVRAEVAANYLGLRGAQAQLAVAQQNATNQTDTLKLAEALRDGGQGTQFDVARARAQLNTTLAAIPPVETEIEQSLNRVAVLCGLPPSALREQLSPTKALPASPSVLSIGNPTDLLRRRPDVRAAERSLAAASARIGVETADLFPAVTFVGSVGLQANRLSGFGDSGTEAWGFGPHISWAALDLGRVRQRINAADARTQGALAVYEKTVLLALEETENSLVALEKERRRLGYLKESEKAALEAVDLARQRYRDGVADFLSVLDAERTLLSLQEEVVASETRSATRLVAVYKALGGAEQPAD